MTVSSKCTQVTATKLAYVADLDRADTETGYANKQKVSLVPPTPPSDSSRRCSTAKLVMTAASQGGR